MTDLRDHPLPRGALYRARQGRLEVVAHVTGDSLVIHAESDSIARQVTTQTEVAQSRQVADKTMQRQHQERREPSSIWTILGLLPYLLMIALAVWVYFKVFN